MQMHGPRSDRAKDRDIHWRIKAKTSEELRQEFLSIYVPRILELGLTLPDPELGLDESTGEWRYTEPDWQELRTVVTNHGPSSEERLAFRRLNHDKSEWVRDTILRSSDGWSRGAPPRTPEGGRRVAAEVAGSGLATT
jgi:ring-1,2-phenylacetyl-CoA epoxidase subunit PaaA